MENETELQPINDMSEEPLTLDNIESMEADDDNLIMGSALDTALTNPRGHFGCEDCNIPFVTKKELKVNFQCTALIKCYTKISSI